MTPGAFFYDQIGEDGAQSGVCGLLATFGPRVAIDAIVICVFAHVAIRIFAHGRLGGASCSLISSGRRPRRCGDSRHYRMSRLGEEPRAGYEQGNDEDEVNPEDSGSPVEIVSPAAEACADEMPNIAGDAC